MAVLVWLVLRPALFHCQRPSYDSISGSMHWSAQATRTYLAPAGCVCCVFAWPMCGGSGRVCTSVKA
eukprot:scaffold29183_cov111-Isochrysis_galbana.AAC.1